MNEKYSQIPDELIALARDDFMVKQGIDHYLTGHMTWEETLVAIAVNLSSRNKELTERCLELTQRIPPAPIVIESLPNPHIRNHEEDDLGLITRFSIEW